MLYISLLDQHSALDVFAAVMAATLFGEFAIHLVVGDH